MKRYKNPGILAGLLWLLVTSPGSVAYAGNWLEVRVVDRQSGSAVGQAAVCLGTTARPDQFGARRADTDGVVRFEDLPVNDMVLVASRRGYRGKQQRVEPLSGNRVIVLSLAPGGGGPVCTAAIASVPPQTAEELVITDVRVTPDKTALSTATVIVKITVSGEADQVRISESADFAGAGWKDLKPENRYVVSPRKGVKQLYVQVRRVVKTKGASIESLSPVKVVQYRFY
jgi:hypothetical protein